MANSVRFLYSITSRGDSFSYVGAVYSLARLFPLRTLVSSARFDISMKAGAPSSSSISSFNVGFRRPLMPPVKSFMRFLREPSRGWLSRCWRRFCGDDASKVRDAKP